MKTDEVTKLGERKHRKRTRLLSWKCVPVYFCAYFEGEVGGTCNAHTVYVKQSENI